MSSAFLAVQPVGRLVQFRMLNSRATRHVFVQTMSKPTTRIHPSPPPLTRVSCGLTEPSLLLWLFISTRRAQVVWVSVLTAMFVHRVSSTSSWITSRGKAGASWLSGLILRLRSALNELRLVVSSSSTRVSNLVLTTILSFTLVVSVSTTSTDRPPSRRSRTRVCR